MSHEPPQHGAGRLLAMHRGDQEAARSLWAANAGRLTALARAITGSHADALDAVQEAFVAVLQLGRAQVAAVEDERGYLAGAVRARALNLLRSSGRRVKHEQNSRPALRLVGQPDEDAELQETLAALPVDVRDLVALKHIAGLTFDQMAAVLNVPRATVASRYYDAVEQLRRALAAQNHREVARA